mgnify:FL=1
MGAPLYLPAAAATVAAADYSLVGNQVGHMSALPSSYCQATVKLKLPTPYVSVELNQQQPSLNTKAQHGTALHKPLNTASQHATAQHSTAQMLPLWAVGSAWSVPHITPALLQKPLLNMRASTCLRHVH